MQCVMSSWSQQLCWSCPARSSTSMRAVQAEAGLHHRSGAEVPQRDLGDQGDRW